MNSIRTLQPILSSACKLLPLLFIGIFNVGASTVINFPWFSSKHYSFDFENLGSMTTPFSETVDDLTVYYSSISPGGFQVIPVDLEQVLFSVNNTHHLEIRFSERIYGISVGFMAYGSGIIDFQTFDGDVPRISGSADLSGPTEEHITLMPVCVCPNFFDRFVLTSTSPDSLAVTGVYVAHYTPDSGSSFLMFSFGFIGVVSSRHFSRRRRDL